MKNPAIIAVFGRLVALSPSVCFIKNARLEIQIWLENPLSRKNPCSKLAHPTILF